MKALSIKEPWASMILNGRKSIETRTWRTNHRGALLLCASKTPKSSISGKAFAVADLVDCRPMMKEDESQACCEVYNAYSWVLMGVRPIVPFDVKGKLNIFEVEIGNLPKSPHGGLG